VQVRLEERFRRSAVAVVYSHDIGYTEHVEKELEWFTSVSLEKINAAEAVESYQGESDAKVVEPQSMHPRYPPINAVEHQDGGQDRTNN
jgi:hypothetical protein